MIIIMNEANIISFYGRLLLMEIFVWNINIIISFGWIPERMCEYVHTYIYAYVDSCSVCGTWFYSNFWNYSKSKVVRYAHIAGAKTADEKHLDKHTQGAEYAK